MILVFILFFVDVWAATLIVEGAKSRKYHLVGLGFLIMIVSGIILTGVFFK